MLNKILTMVLLLFFVIGGYVAYTAVTLPNVRKALASGVEPTQTSQILARDKTLLMSYGKFQHKPLALSEMPPALIDALISTEDRRFYHHKGIDPVGIARALVRNVGSHGVHEGGSTLTQQLARNIFLSNERSLQRKVKEMLLAIKIEQQLTKDQILELYLNNVYFGEGAYGIGAASNIYFGKRPKNLTTAESALLAGLPQAPSLYNPFANPQLAVNRRNEVLDNMEENGKLSESQVRQLKQATLRLNPNGRALSSSDKAPFFSRYVIQEVESMLDLDDQAFWQQGLKVYTTLDPRAQNIAQTQVRTLSQAFGRTGGKQQAALLSLNSKGGMIAYVGGKDFSISQFDRVSQARRPAGSLFKIFVYSTALARGYSPLTVYKDAPVTFGSWTPQNYDKGHHGYMTLAQALIQSNNVIAVKLLNDLSPAAVIQTAQKMGVESKMEPNLSLALGAADVSLREMTGAFSVFSNNGNLVKPYAIEKIVDRDGRILYQHDTDSRSVLPRTPRDTMVELLQGVVKYGTGRAAAFGRPVGGKTGTSDDYRDAWFIGFTPEVTTGVWVGNDDNSKMYGITGGSIPARIWRAYMSRLLSGVPKKDFDLAYALPVEEKDFFVYNLENLSASEGHPPEEIVQPEAYDPENPGQALEGQEGFVENQIDEQYPQDGSSNPENEMPKPYPQDPVALPPARPPGQTEERFTSPGPNGSNERFYQENGNSQGVPKRFVPDSTNSGHKSGIARPIVNPVQGLPTAGPKATAGPKTQPQQPIPNGYLKND